VATSSQDGAAGAGTHAQTEAVGLGPATVVRLERALAHEVSPLLHSHAWICAEGGAGYKVGRCRHGQTTGLPQACESGRQHRPRPRYVNRQGTVKLIRLVETVGQHTQRKPPMVNQHRWPCQATRRATQIFLNEPTMKSLSGRPDPRAVAVLASRLPQLRALCTICG